MPITFSLISQDKTVTEAEVDEVLIPTQTGQIGVLPGHVDLVTLLATGEITVKSHGKNDYFAVFGGVAEINSKEVVILADRAERVTDIDLAAAEEAQRKAAMMVKEAKSEEEMAHAMALLERNINRIQLVKTRHHHGSHQHTPESIQ